MRILQIAPYVTNNSIPIPNKNVTGFGYMVYDIAKGLAMYEEVDFIVLNKRYQSFFHDKINFIGITWLNIAMHIFSCTSPFRLLSLLGKYAFSFNTILHTGYYWLLSGFIRKILDRGHYDIVHIHGAGLYNEFIIDILQKEKIPFLLTLHGLVSFSDSVILEDGIKRYEKDLLAKSLLHNWFLSVISTGMKMKIESYFHKTDIANIYVINNFISFSSTEIKGETSIKIRELYNIPADSKIVLYVGNISMRKNQKIMVEAYLKLSDTIKHHVYVLFCGNIKDDGNTVMEMINQCDYKEHLILCGNIAKEDMKFYYDQVDAVALLSISEGFGLGLIEGMHYGLPSIASKAIESFEDLYSQDSVIGVDVNNLDDVVKGLETLLNHRWDNQKIKNHSLKFESKNQIGLYLSVFNKISSKSE